MFLIDSIRQILKKENNQFFVSIAIRSFAIGMVLIFEPIYIYTYFNSLSLTLLFFAAIHGVFGVLVVFGGRLMAKISTKYIILISHFFFFGYYLSLFFISQSLLMIPLAIFLRAIGMILFWPAYHTDFTRFSATGYQGRAVGKISVFSSIPSIIGPVIGGSILALGGYHALFIVVLITLLFSSFPMLLSRESHIIYTDSFLRAWQRIFKRENLKTSLAFAADCVEGSIAYYLWPVFMFVLAISYTAMGGIVTFALAFSTVFTIYMGRMSDKIINRVWFLNIGSVLTSMAWIMKYFVITPLDAFLAHALYRICRASASIPFQTFFYKKVAQKGPEADEFIIYREIVINLARLFFFIVLAGVFYFIPQINLAFLAAAVISLGFMFLGLPPKIKW
jgi:MFS family permease